jgi:hypothetical protein
VVFSTLVNVAKEGGHSSISTILQYRELSYTPFFCATEGQINSREEEPANQLFFIFHLTLELCGKEILSTAFEPTIVGR